MSVQENSPAPSAAKPSTTKPAKSLPRKGTKARALLDARREQAAKARAAYLAQRGQRTPQQIAKAAENKRYRDRLRSKARRDAAAAGRPVPVAKIPDAQLTPEQLKKREANRRYNANRKSKANGGAVEQSFPLEAIPDRMPAFARERGSSKPSAASIGGFDAKMLTVLEIARLFNRLLDGQ
jgi:hypothetical protein